MPGVIIWPMTTVYVILTLYTCGVGVALQRLGTHAHCTVVVDPADGSVPALLQLTRVPTLLTNTCEVQRTFGV